MVLGRVPFLPLGRELSEQRRRKEDGTGPDLACCVISEDGEVAVAVSIFGSVLFDSAGPQLSVPTAQGRCGKRVNSECQEGAGARLPRAVFSRTGKRSEPEYRADELRGYGGRAASQA